MHREQTEGAALFTGAGLWIFKIMIADFLSYIIQIPFHWMNLKTFKLECIRYECWNLKKTLKVVYKLMIFDSSHT